jgi:hypothetical protein
MKVSANFAFFAALGMAAAPLSSFASVSNPTVGLQLLRGKIDLSRDTITLPLHLGSLQDGRKVWYVLTDVSVKATATAEGLVYAPALAAAARAKSTRTATRDRNGEFVFNSGAVDFTPARMIQPGMAPNLFPPVSAQPGSMADAGYSPFVRIDSEGGAVYNAPIIAFDVDASAISACDGKANANRLHDHVVAICPEKKEVTLALIHGFASGKPIVYLTFDANVGLAATLEGDTLAPSIDDLKGIGATLSLYAATNGQVGKNNPNRQGFDSALSGDGAPLNVLSGIPTLEAGYSPLWDIHVIEWSAQAVQNGQNALLKSASDVFAAFHAGLLTAAGGGAPNSSGILVNCPAVAILQ